MGWPWKNSGPRILQNYFIAISPFVRKILAYQFKYRLLAKLQSPWYLSKTPNTLKKPQTIRSSLVLDSYCLADFMSISLTLWHFLVQNLHFTLEMFSISASKMMVVLIKQ
jgi:hypothetical protein